MLVEETVCPNVRSQSGHPCRVGAQWKGSVQRAPVPKCPRGAQPSSTRHRCRLERRVPSGGCRRPFSLQSYARREPGARNERRARFCHNRRRWRRFARDPSSKQSEYYPKRVKQAPAWRASRSAFTSQVWKKGPAASLGSEGRVAAFWNNRVDCPTRHRPDNRSYSALAIGAGRLVGIVLARPATW